MIKGSKLTLEGYTIPKNKLTDKQLQLIEKELTVTPLNSDYAKDGDPNTKYKIYKIDEENVIIPRYYGIQKFGIPEFDNFEPKKVNIKFTSELREYQKDITDKCLVHVRKHGGGLLVVPCGSGKTVMAIYMAAQLGLKTLIITHKTFLQDQWIDRCKQFTKSKVGIIRQNTVDVEGKHFVVAMVQSLSRRDYDPEIFKDFGICIIDETHRFGSKHFSKALMKTGAKYTFGLSATPRRSDGLFKVVKWLLGDIMFEKKLQTNNQVVAKIITYHSKDKLFKEKKRFINGKVRPDCVKMITNLITLESRNQHIINVIDQLRKDPERKILILSGRKNHLTHLKNSVDKLIQNDVDAEIILKDECKTYYYTGDIKRDERTEAEKEADILFGTYDMAHEGLDIDRLNTIILTTPKKDVEQAVGRILRKILQNGDIRPLVVDFVDNLPIFSRQGETRETFYKKSKYVQQYYYAVEDDLVSPRKYLKVIGDENNDVSKKTPESYEEILSVPPVEIIDECPDPNENSDKPKKSSSKTKTYKDPLDVKMF
jgi:superfamily II DNA or RNA helicase